MSSVNRADFRDDYLQRNNSVPFRLSRYLFRLQEFEALNNFSSRFSRLDNVIDMRPDGGLEEGIGVSFGVFGNQLCAKLLRITRLRNIVRVEEVDRLLRPHHPRFGDGPGVDAARF